MSAAREKIAIVTDSTADLGPAAAESYGISVLPLHVVYSEGSYRDGVDITPDEISARLEREIPTTSAPSPQEAIDLLTGLRQRGFTHALAIHISGAVSRTLDTVRLAAEEVSGLATAVIDSRAVSMAMGFVAVEAARLAAQGKTTFAELVERVKATVPHSNIFCVLKTLEYFRRGGRIGAVAAAVAGALNIKPIISMKEGAFYAPQRVRGRKESLEALFGMVREAVVSGANRVAVIHWDALEEAQALCERLKSLPGLSDPFFGRLGTVLGVHGGPGTVGICVARV